MLRAERGLTSLQAVIASAFSSRRSVRTISTTR
jgi:hypothetical protein